MIRDVEHRFERRRDARGEKVGGQRRIGRQPLLGAARREQHRSIAQSLRQSRCVGLLLLLLLLRRRRRWRSRIRRIAGGWRDGDERGGRRDDGIDANRIRLMQCGGGLVTLMVVDELKIMSNQATGIGAIEDIDSRRLQAELKRVDGERHILTIVVVEAPEFAIVRGGGHAVTVEEKQSGVRALRLGAQLLRQTQHLVNSGINETT
jgi:hypothetical protein